MGSLLGGSKKQTSTSTKNVPAWALPSLQKALSMADAAASTPYEAYTGQRYAPLNSDELASMSMTRDMIGDGSVSYDSAKQGMNSVLDSGINGFSPEYLQKYIDPYRTNVLDIAKRRSLENYSQQMNDYKAKAAQTSSFGGSRSGLAEAQMQKDFEQGLADRETQGLSAAYNNALQQANLGMGRTMSGATGLASLADARQGYDLRDAAALDSIGSKTRAYDQQNKDWDYEQWATQKAYPYQQAQFLSGIASPIAGQVTGDTTVNKTSGGSGVLGTIAGIASMAMGIPGVGAALGSGLGSLAGGLGMSAATGSALNSFFGGTAGSSFMSGLTNSLIGNRMGPMMAEGGVVPSQSVRRLAMGGGAFSGVGLPEDSAVAQFLKSIDINKNIGEKHPVLKSIADTLPVQLGNELAIDAMKNPIDYASYAATAIPVAGEAGLLLKGGSEGLGALGGLGKSAKEVYALAKANPKIASGLAVGAMQAGKHLAEGNRGLQSLQDDKAVQDSQDLNDANDYIMHLNSNGKIGKNFTDPADLSRIQRAILNSPELSSIAKQYGPKGVTKEDTITNTNGINTVAANASSPTDIFKQVLGTSANSEGLGSVSPTSSELFKDKGEKPNMALIKFGAALLQSNNSFFKALGEAGDVFAAQKEKEDTDAKNEQILKYKMAQEEQKQRLYGLQVAAQIAKLQDPYSAKIKELNLKAKEQALMGGGREKLKATIYKQIQSQGMYKPEEAAKMAEDYVDAYYGDSGDNGSDSVIPPPPEDLWTSGQ